MTDWTAQKMFAIEHASEISAARRHSQQLADVLGFAATEAGKLAIVVTEAATNILKHATGGLLLVTPVRRANRNGIEIVALDRGPGIANLAQSLRDGISTAGTAGTGLGAMRRLADDFDVYSTPGHGTAFYLCIWAGLPAAGAAASPDDRLLCGTVCLPVAGEEMCGDAWAIMSNQDGAAVVVADGLGHGPEAALASQMAVRTLQQRPLLQAAPLLEAMHLALRPTRGAAAAVATLDAPASRVTFAGIGNIAASVVDGESRKQLISHNGIVGNNLRKMQEFEFAWPVGSLLILCSDGIGTQWDLNARAGLRFCHPALIAGVLYRDFLRARDDATVVVIKRLF
ncbi:MAG: ATP-binding SpoIIE family protein phosphatase [Pseudomonadota bacterium]